MEKIPLKTAITLLCASFAVPFVAPVMAHAESTNVAVAANFTAAAKGIETAFEAATGHDVIFSFGSTGKLYAHIINGAPFDAFLAADARRPQMLEQDGHAVPGSRFTYALGQIALWSSQDDLDVQRMLQTGDFNKLAIANPKTAPYGVAAVQTLEALSLTAQTQDKWIRGDSIAQTRQFVSTGAADLGIVALAQVALDPSGSTWIVPSTFHAPIEQQAVLLVKGAKNPATNSFIAFMNGDKALNIIKSFGYGVKD